MKKGMGKKGVGQNGGELKPACAWGPRECAGGSWKPLAAPAIGLLDAAWRCLGQLLPFFYLL